MSLKGIGWIPNLNGNITLKNPFANKKSFFIEENKLDIPILQDINKNKTGDEYCLAIHYPLFEIRDNKNENLTSTFVFFLKDKNRYLNSIQIYQSIAGEPENQKHLKIANIIVENINPKGFVTLRLAYFFPMNQCFNDNSEVLLKIKKVVMGKAFEVLHEIYHTHTHHTPEITESSPIMTRLYYIETEKEAYEKVIHWYLDKIRYYHEWIPNYLQMVGKYLKEENVPANKRLEDMSVAEQLIRQAKGEFLYGQNFIIYFHSINPERSSMLLEIFRNAITSVDILAQELNSIYGNVCAEETLQINRSMKKISISVGIIAFLTLFATVVTIAVQLKWNPFVLFTSGIMYAKEIIRHLL